MAPGIKRSYGNSDVPGDMSIFLLVPFALVRFTLCSGWTHEEEGDQNGRTEYPSGGDDGTTPPPL